MNYHGGAQAVAPAPAASSSSASATAAAAIATSKSASSSSSTAAAASSATADSANMYRVGDYVYFENSSSASYAIRRIEELNKTSTGAVEARVICFYRRQELTASLLAQADKHHWGDSVSGPPPDDDKSTGSDSDEEESPQVRQDKKISKVK